MCSNWPIQTWSQSINRLLYERAIKCKRFEQLLNTQSELSHSTECPNSKLVVQWISYPEDKCSLLSWFSWEIRKPSLRAKWGQSLKIFKSYKGSFSRWFEKLVKNQKTNMSTVKSRYEIYKRSDLYQLKFKEFRDIAMQLNKIPNINMYCIYGQMERSHIVFIYHHHET